MRLAALVAVTMAAFAANSLLNRAAIVGGEAGAVAFAAIRVASGAAALWALARASGQAVAIRGRSFGAAAALTVYLFGFSFAYLALDAGLGALILFGGVQVTMFAGALLGGARPSPGRWAGMALGLAGLVWLTLPGKVSGTVPWAAMSMLAAAVGWGVYSLIGRGAVSALGETAAAFILTTPIALVVWAATGSGVTWEGAVLALVSGVITSGLGYALWYTVLPRIEATVAALAQLTVPVLAVLGGAALLGERPEAAALAAAAVILGGVALGILSGISARADRS